MFYDNLKNFCDSNGLKISNVVKECGGALGSISKWRNGAYPNSEIITKLSLHLGVTADYLLFGKEKNTPQNDLTETEQEMLKLYSQLQISEQYKIIGMLEEKLKNKTID